MEMWRKHRGIISFMDKINPVCRTLSQAIGGEGDRIGFWTARFKELLINCGRDNGFLPVTRIEDGRNCYKDPFQRYRERLHKNPINSEMNIYKEENGILVATQGFLDTEWKYDLCWFISDNTAPSEEKLVLACEMEWASGYSVEEWKWKIDEDLTKLVNIKDISVCRLFIYESKSNRRKDEIKLFKSKLNNIGDPNFIILEVPSPFTSVSMVTAEDLHNT